MKLYKNNLGENLWKKDLLSKDLIIDIPYSAEIEFGYELLMQGYTDNLINSYNINIDEKIETVEEFILISDIIDKSFYKYTINNEHIDQDNSVDPSEFDCGDGKFDEHDYERFSNDEEIDSSPNTYNKVSYYSKNYILVSDGNGAFNYKNYLGKYFFNNFIKCQKIGFINGETFIIKNNGFNFINKYGDLLFDYNFRKINHINFLGYIVCEIGNKFNLLDTNLKLVFEKSYDYLSDYFDSKPKVHLFNVWHDSYLYVIEKEIIDNMFLVIRSGNKWNILNKKFEFIFNEDVDFIFNDFDSYNILGNYFTHDSKPSLHNKIIKNNAIYNYNIIENKFSKYLYNKNYIINYNNKNYIIYKNGNITEINDKYTFITNENNFSILKDGIDIIKLEVTIPIENDIIKIIQDMNATWRENYL